MSLGIFTCVHASVGVVGLSFTARDSPHLHPFSSSFFLVRLPARCRALHFFRLRTIQLRLIDLHGVNEDWQWLMVLLLQPLMVAVLLIAGCARTNLYNKRKATQRVGAD